MPLADHRSDVDGGTDILRRVMSASGYGRGVLLVMDRGSGFSVASQEGVSHDSAELLRLLRETTIPTLISPPHRVLVYRCRRKCNGSPKTLVECFGGELVAVPMVVHDVTVGLVLLGARERRQAGRPVQRRQLLTVAGMAGLIWKQMQIGRQAALASEMAPALGAAVDLQSDREMGDRLRQLIRHDANFTKLLSHQLRTPLTSIRGFAQLILRRETIDPELVRKYVGIIFDKSGYLIDTIEEVRGLAAVTSDLLALKQEPLFILPLVRRVLSAVEPFTRHRLELSLPVETVLIRADQERVTQVLNTLLCNAMRRSGSDLPIQVGVESTPASVVVWVADHGSVMSRSEMDEAFEWGEPSDDSIEDDGARSNSLALYACRRLVQAHGGRVWVESEADQTRFCFELFA